MLLSACRLNAETSRPVPAAVQPAKTPIPQPTITATPPPTFTPTETSTPTPSPTPTNTPTPTPTPIPSDRLVLAQRAYAGGDYETARFEFDALLADPGADAYEQRQALHWRGRSELKIGDTAAAIAGLQMFLQQHPSDELARAAQFNLGLAYEQSGQPQEAANAYLGTIIPDDPVNVYIYERIGDIRLKTGAYTETIAAYQAGINATDDPSFQVHLREGIAQAELRLNDNPEAAIAQYLDILDIAKIGAYRAKILRLLGDARIAADDPEDGYESYMKAVNLYPEAYDSYLALVELVNAGVPVDEFQRGLVDYHAGAYQPAIVAFEEYLTQPTPPAQKSPPSTDESPSAESTFASPILTNTQPAPKAAPPESTPPEHAAEALWYTGLSWKALGRYNSAILTFQKFIDAYPDAPKWGEAHLEMGQTLIKQDSHSRAKTVLRDFAAKNPDHPLAPEALWQAARLDMSDELFDQARAHLHTLVDKYPDGEYAADALYWAGQSAYKVEDYEGAVEDWATLVDKYPDSELISHSAYWRAIALQKLGQAEQAKTALTHLTNAPIDYYTLRARDLLTGQLPQPVPLKLPTQTELADEQAEAETWLRQWLNPTKTDNLSAVGVELQNDPAFQRGDALLKLGLRDEALIEFESAKNNWQDDALAMYQLSIYFQEKGLGRLSIISAARLIFLSPARTPEDAPIFIQRLYYPLYFEEVIFAEADKFKRDPALIAGIIRQESLFEPSAHSYAGARGLMQVMPTTGEYVAERGGFDNFNTDQLWLPYISIKFGAWYIDQQLRIFEDNQFAALAAYNAGPGNVLEWIKISDDVDIFVESIPFQEPRLYIRKIYVNLEAYRRIYGSP